MAGSSARAEARWVRTATRDEASSIAGVLRAAFLDYEPLYTPGGFSATTPTAAEISSRWHEGPVWVAGIDDRTLGTGAAVVKGVDLYVRSMAVLPATRGQGLGRALLEHIESFARDHSCSRLYLSTTPFLDHAIRMYERFGFVRTDAEPKELHGTPLFTMEKILP